MLHAKPSQKVRAFLMVKTKKVLITKKNVYRAISKTAGLIAAYDLTDLIWEALVEQSEKVG